MDDRKHPDDTVAEEASALGQRVKGAAKDAVGAVTGNRSLEREGERENAVGRARQGNNDVMDETDGVPTRSVSGISPKGAGKYGDDTVAEEASAFGERIKGAAKDAAGAVTGNATLEREGERENREGRVRQANNDVMDETDGVPKRSVGGNDHFVTGLYDSPETAGRAYDDLTTKHGYKPDDISVVMSDETRKKHFGAGKSDTEFGNKASQGAGVGGSIGLGVGAALGAFVAAATAIAIPGVGIVLAGPIAGAIAGAGAGAATGGVLGALIGAGIPEDRAAEYETGINQGGILMGTRARDVDHAATLERDFSGYGARNVRR
jgi:uncharacterized protein YjbJ (UPF0337 family)